MAATAATSFQSAFRLFPVHVDRTVWLTPRMVRVTLAGDSLAGFVNGGRDQRCKVLFPLPGQSAPLMPDNTEALGWYQAWRGMPDDIRPVLRTYTIRAQRTEPDEIDIDFAVHGDLGPASRWVSAAVPGDRLLVFGPAREQAGAVAFDPPPGTGQVLLVGDETALPAIASILETLGPELPTQVCVEVGGAGEELPLPGTARVRWLHRGGGPSRLLDAVRTVDLSGPRPYVWVAGEAAAVRELRRHLVGERGIDREAVYVGGYWRAGLTEDDDSTATESSD